MRTVTQTEIPAFLIELEEAFNQAMISNDVERISRCITDDWILITPEVGPRWLVPMLAEGVVGVVIGIVVLLAVMAIRRMRGLPAAPAH